MQNEKLKIAKQNSKLDIKERSYSFAPFKGKILNCNFAF